MNKMRSDLDFKPKTLTSDIPSLSEPLATPKRLPPDICNEPDPSPLLTVKFCCMSGKSTLTSATAMLPTGRRFNLGASTCLGFEV